MAACNLLLLLLLLSACLAYQSDVDQSETLSPPSDFTLSFPLATVRLRRRRSSTQTTLYSSSVASQRSDKAPVVFRSRLQHASVALIASLPFGTPPQQQEMVVDTGSQLPWVQCRRTKRQQRADPPGARASFDPDLSTSFSVVPCNHPLCRPAVTANALPTSCGLGHRCLYSLFYADGTFAEGNLIQEKFDSRLPVALGCSNASTDDGRGILGMNLGALSFASQSKVTKFSYCVPRPGSRSSGSLVLGNNPISGGFRYISLVTLGGQYGRMPNYDSLAYTVRPVGIRVNRRMVNVSAAVFLPNPNGSGQTMVDSGTEFTYLVEEAYQAVRAEIARAEEGLLRGDGYAYQGALDMCVAAGERRKLARAVGEVAFVFEGGAEMGVAGGGNLVAGDGGKHCVAIGRSDALGISGNVIGNFHQRGRWLEFDRESRRLGFGRVDDCA